MMKTHKINFAYVLFVILFYFFLLKDYLERVFPILSYSDELIALVAIPIFISRTKTRLDKKQPLGSGLFIILFLFVGLLGSLIYRYQPFVKAVLPDILLCAKFWMTVYVGRFALQGMSFKRYAPKIFMHVKFVSWTYIILIILNYIGILNYKIGIRYGLPSFKLFYFHPTVLVFCCVFLLAVLISIKSYVHGTNKYFFLICFICCCTLRSKAFGAVLLFVYVYYIVFVYRKKVTLRNIIMLAPFVLLVAWNQIQYYFFGDNQGDSARYQMLFNSFKVAFDYFPLGSGFATYGSYMSAKYYSPLYYKYGMSQVWGLSAYDSRFVNDSFWPMILGQTGWIGLLLYVVAIIKLFQEIQKIEKRSLALYSSGLIILLYVIIDSTGSAAFVSPLSIPLAFWLGVILNEAKVREKAHNDRIALEEAQKALAESGPLQDEAVIESEYYRKENLGNLKDIRFNKKLVQKKPQKFDKNNDFKLEKPKEEENE